MVGLRGLEPPTPAMSTQYSNQLSYKPINGAEDRNRTGTRGKPRGILSPVRLPVPPLRLVEAAPRFELGNKGFADLCLTTWLCRQKY